MFLVTLFHILMAVFYFNSDKNRIMDINFLLNKADLKYFILDQYFNCTEGNIEVSIRELITEKVVEHSLNNGFDHFQDNRVLKINLNIPETGERITANVFVKKNNTPDYYIILDPHKDEEYKSIFENAVLGIYKSSPGSGRHLSCNPELARIYGYESVEDLLNNITDISHQLYVNPERRVELINSLKEKDETIGFESQLYRKGGKLIWISENARAVKDEKGDIKFLVGTVKDITELKLAEENMRLAKEDWERTFDAIDSSIIILDKNLEIRRLNRTAREVLKIAGENYSGAKCFSIFNCKKELCNECPANRTINEHRSFSTEIENPDTGKNYFCYSSPIFDNNIFTGVVFVMKDITEEKKLRREADYRLQQVIQADKLKSLGEMVAGISHEINNPNSIILTNISLLEETWQQISNVILEPDFNSYALPPQEELEECTDLIKSVKNGSQRIKNIVSNLKDFARINTSGIYKPIDLNEVISKTLLIIGSYAKKNVTELKIECSDNLPLVKAHFQNLEQVLINLIINSIQSFENRENSRIVIRSKYIQAGNYVILEVEDNGPGIEESIQNKIFEPFFTTRREKGGTGLGLSICYDMIKNMNGLISLHSKEMFGTRFCIFLPVSEKTPDLKPKIVCVGFNQKLSNLWNLNFTDTSEIFFVFLNEPAMLVNYLFDHPEVDTIVINISAGLFLLELTKKIIEKNKLINIILINDKLVDYSNMITEVYDKVIALDEPENMTIVEQMLTSLMRLKI